MTTAPRVRYVVHRPGHHSPHSGYSRVAQYGVARYQGGVIRAKPLPRNIIRDRIMWRFANGVVSYNRASMAAEIKTAWNMFKSSEYIYHILYGEIIYHYLGFLNNFRQNRLVATFHQPPSRIQQVVRIDWHIRQLSAVICVGRSQQEFFAKFLDKKQIFFVPLGIDTEYFTPPQSFDDRDPNLCLFVGQHFRDFPTLRGVIELVAFQRPETRFVAVTSPGSFELVGYHPNLTLLSGIAESELLDLYHSAALMVMPLRDATANNGLLEAIACGLPTVVTDVGSTRDYVSHECAALTQLHDSQGMAETVLNLLDDPLERRRMSEQARQQALKFSWPKVVEQLGSVYTAIT